MNTLFDLPTDNTKPRHRASKRPDNSSRPYNDKPRHRWDGLSCKDKDCTHGRLHIGEAFTCANLITGRGM